MEPRRSEGYGGEGYELGAAAEPLRDWLTVQRFADELYNLLHSPLAIDTPASELIAYSSQDDSVDPVRMAYILHRRPTPNIRAVLDRPEVMARWGQSSVPFRLEPLPDLGFCGRIAVPVHVDGQLVCRIWLIEGAQPFGHQDMALLADVSKELSRSLREAMRSREDSESRPTQALVHALLHQSIDEARARHRARALGLKLPSQFRVLKVAQVRPEQQSFDVDRVLRLARTHARQSGLLLFAERDDSDSMVLLIGRIEATPIVHAAFGDRLLEELSRANLQVALGMSGPYQQLSKAPSAAAEADRCLRVFGLVGGNKAASPETVGLLQFLPLLTNWYETYGATDGVHGVIRLLRREEGRDDAHFPLIETLGALLDCGGDAATTAQRLSLHRNTLHYRLHRVAEVAGVNLADGDALLPVHLELTLRRLLQLESTLQAHHSKA